MEMNKIIKNEMYKFFKSRKNIIIMILFFVYLLVINLYNLKQYGLYMKETEQLYENRYNQAGSMLVSKKISLEKDEGLTSEKKEILEREIEFYGVERLKLVLMANTYGEDKLANYKNILTVENGRYENIIKGMSNGSITEEFLDDRNLKIEDIYKTMYLNQYILENEIQPLLNPYTMTGANSLSMFLDGNNLIILMFIIALLSIDIYLSELEEGSYKLSYTQPFRRNQIFLGKAITIIIISLALIGLGAILNFVIVSIIYGVGDMNYPLITGEVIKGISFSGNHGRYIILPLWKYVILGFSLLIPIMLFTIAVVIGISILTDSNSKTLALSIMLIGLAFIFKNFVSRQSIVNLIYPYSYLFVRDVIELKNYSNYLLGILLNTLIAIGLFIMSYHKFIHKDFLGARE